MNLYRGGVRIPNGLQIVLFSALAAEPGQAFSRSRSSVELYQLASLVNRSWVERYTTKQINVLFVSEFGRISKEIQSYFWAPWWPNTEQTLAWWIKWQLLPSPTQKLALGVRAPITIHMQKICVSFVMVVSKDGQSRVLWLRADWCTWSMYTAVPY